jgi:glycosyltransferase involved in cell wall biosynthesis
MAGRVNAWADLDVKVSILIPEFMKTKVLENGMREKVKKFYAWNSVKEFKSSLGIIYLYWLRIFFSFQILFKRENFDIGFSNSPVLVDIAPILWLKIFKRCTCWVLMIDSIVPHPSMRTGSNLINYLTYCEARLVQYLAKMFASKIFTVNVELKNSLVNSGFNANSIFISKNGLFLDRIGSQIPDNKIYEAAYMGRITENKGIFDLLNCWQLVVRERPLAKLVVMGTGREDVVRSFSSQIDALCLQENVIYLGYVENNRKYEILKQAKIQIFLSKVNADESWGISLMEGLACGLPSITCDLDIYRHVYDIGILITVPVAAINSAYECIDHLLNNDSYRNLLSKAGIKFTSRFDWTNIAKNDLTQLKGLVKNL